MNAGKSWIAPATGAVLAVLFVVIFALIGEGQDATDKTAQEVVNHYRDHDTKESIASILIGVAGIFMLFFASWLRSVLRDAEGPNGILSTVVFGAGVVFAAGAAVGGSIHLALADLADDIDPIAIQAINGIDFDLFLFFPVGLGTMLLAAGISAVRNGSLPKWLAWAGVVIGVIGVSPVFWIGFFLAPLWILIVSIMGIVRSGNGASSAPAAA